MTSAGAARAGRESTVAAARPSAASDSAANDNGPGGPRGPGGAPPFITALTPSGLRLPVIDVTDPRFHVADDAASLQRLTDAFTAWDRRQGRLPAPLARLMLKLAARRSRLLTAFARSDTGVLDAITTYVMKLGPAALPAGYDTAVDRRIAALPHMIFLRLRLQQVATLIAEAVAAPLAAAPGTPLALVNIAGGPALDSLNALILLRRRDPALTVRPITVHVLDPDAEGPGFGRNALVALAAPGAPLHGLEVRVAHRPYDWDDAAPLALLAAQCEAEGAIVAASSEGGLFEYGSDAAVVANLQALAAGAGATGIAGSVPAASAARRRMIAEAWFAVQPRGAAGLAPLAAQAGWHLARVEPGVLSEQVLLQRNSGTA